MSKYKTGIFFKTTNRKCSISNYNCFDIWDSENKKKYPSKDYDVIMINIGDVCLGLEIVKDKIHLFSYNKDNLEINPLTATFEINVKEN